MSLMNLTRILDNASDIPFDLGFLAGAGMLLLHDKLLPLVQIIRGRYYWHGALSNDFLHLAQTVHWDA